MASALFKLSSDGGSTYADPGVALADDEALTYNASGTYSIKAALDSTAGVGTAAWTITSADDVNIASLPTVTTNASDKTCTFSVPKTGGAWLLQCIVNGGINLATGKADPTLTRSLAIKVLNSAGQQEVAVGESTEAGAYGWTKAHNDVARAAGGGGGGITEAQLRTAAAALTASLGVNNKKIVNLATPTTSTDAATKGYVDGHLPVVIYRQGVGSAAPGEYASFSAALTAAQALPGPVTLVLDGQDGTPAIPSGTHDLEQRIAVVGLSAGTEKVTVSVTDGAVLQDCPLVANASMALTINTVMFTSTRDGHDTVLDNVYLGETEIPGSAAPFNFNYTSSRVTFRNGTQVQTSANGLGTIPSGKTVTAIVEDATLNAAWQGGAGALNITYWPGNVVPDLSAFTGTATATDKLRDQLADTGGADFDFGAHNLTNLADPTSPQDAATKASSEAAATAAAQNEVNLRAAAAALTDTLYFNAVELADIAAPTSDAGVPYYGLVKEYADGSTTVSIGSTSVSLSAANISTGQVRFTGTLTGDTTVTMPSGIARSLWLINGTSGAYTLKVAGNSSGSTYLVPGQARRVAHDSSGVLRCEAPRVLNLDLSVTVNGDTVGNNDHVLCKIPAYTVVDRAEVIVSTAITGGTAQISIGDSSSYNQLLAATSLASIGDYAGDDTSEAGSSFSSKLCVKYTTAQTLKLRCAVSTSTLTAGVVRVFLVCRYVGEP